MCVARMFVTLAATVATLSFQKLFFVLFCFVAGDITMWCKFLMNVLAIFMVEEFYIYAVVQFFSAGKKCNV